MTDNTPEELEDDGAVKVQIALWPHDAGEKALRQIGLGLAPFILFEVDYDEETRDTTFTFNGSWIDSHEELIEMLESGLEMLKAAVAQDGEVEA